MPVINIRSSSVILQKNTFQYLKGPGIMASHSHFSISYCKLMNNNHYRDYGAAITINDCYDTQMISNCHFSYTEHVESIIYISGDDANASLYFNNNIFYNSQGISIYLQSYCYLNISGDIMFKNNTAEKGAGIYISDHSTVIFGENSNVKFINNSVDHNGSAIFMNSHSSVIYEQNSIVTFKDNKGIRGIIYSKDNSNIILKATFQVIFNSNSVTQHGAAIYSYNNCHVTFTGSSNVTFNNNTVPVNEKSIVGGIIFSDTHSHISFDENSTIVFSNNSANVSASILSSYKSSITFKGRSKVIFNSNAAQFCGILTSALFSSITFMDTTKVAFNYNLMLCTSTSNCKSYAGAICTL